MKRHMIPYEACFLLVLGTALIIVLNDMSKSDSTPDSTETLESNELINNATTLFMLNSRSSTKKSFE